MSNSENPIASRRETVGQWLTYLYEWRIPVYQRHYAWNPEEEFGPTQLFWNIVEEQAKKHLAKEPVSPHYFGAILVEHKPAALNSIHQYDVVDGQQRLTTIHIAMFAIIGIASQLGHREKVQDQLAEYVFNDPAQDARQKPKLVPTNFDRTQFSNLRSFAYDTRAKYRDDSEQAKLSKVVQACDFFTKKFKAFIDKNPGNDEAIIDLFIKVILDEFELVLIPLKKTDEAQKVFESLNNTASQLTTFDLIRNNVFYRAEQEISGSDEKLFRSDEWQQFEEVFWEKSSGVRSDKASHIETYIGRMLIAKQKKEFSMKRNSIFREYKNFAAAEKSKGLGVQSEIETISEYVNVYKHLMGESKKNPLSADFEFGYFMRKHCESTEWHPVIFVIANSNIDVAEKQRMIALLESYVIRRLIAQLTSKGYNKQVPMICAQLGSKPSYTKLREFFHEPDSDTRKFPSNDEMLSACLHNDFYPVKKPQKYVFARIVDHVTTDTDEKRDLSELTIDHIMPQSWYEKDGWKKIAENYSDDEIDRRIHTIGNLTPMSQGLNSQKSNHAWLPLTTGKYPPNEDLILKQSAQMWLKQCDLKLTRKLADKPKWDLDDIDERSKELAGYICKIWPMDIE